MKTIENRVADRFQKIGVQEPDVLSAVRNAEQTGKSVRYAVQRYLKENPGANAALIIHTVKKATYDASPKRYRADTSRKLSEKYKRSVLSRADRMEKTNPEFAAELRKRVENR